MEQLCENVPEMHHAKKYCDETFMNGRIKYEILTPDEIIQYIMKHMREESNNENSFDLAIDVGCGHGSSTWLLSPYFKSVLGLDPSAIQIEKAKTIGYKDNVNYDVCAEDNFPVDDGSVDLITVAFSAHFFDMEKFVRECLRVLKPDGCAFIYGYQYYDLARVDGNDQKFEDAEAKFLLHNFMENMIAFCEKHCREELFIMRRYQPQFEMIKGMKKCRMDDLFAVVEITLAELRLYFGAPAYKAFFKKTTVDGGENPLENLVKSLKRLWDVENENEHNIKISMKLSVFMVHMSKNH